MIKINDELELKIITINDAQDMFEYASDERITKFLPWTAHKNLDETKDIIKNFFNFDKENPNFGIFYNGKLIGTCGASMPMDGDNLELGYTVGIKYQGKGIGTACMKGFIDWAFKNGFKKLYARVLENNEVSKHIVENKLGFKKTGKSIEHSGIRGPEYVLEKQDD